MKDFLKTYRASFLFGVLAGLAFPPFYLIIFLPISFYYLINKTLANNKLKETLLFSLIFGFGYYLVQLYWISFSLLVDIKTYFWLVPFAITIIPLACSLYFTISVVLFYYFVKKFNIQNKFLITVVFSFTYIILEYIKGLIFPWNLFSYILGFSDLLIQPVSIINIYLFNFILILFFSFSFVLFKYENKKIIFIKSNKYYSLIYIFIFLSIIIFGFFRLQNAKINKFNLNFRLVQANIPQNLKWDKKEMEKNLEKYLNLTAGDGYKNIDVFIWAESAIPYILTENSILNNKFDIFSDKILITGAIRGEIKENILNKIWNSIFIIKNNEIIDYYDKSILVPFGEYIPFSKYIPFMKKITEGSIEFSKGYGNITLSIDNFKISPIVCYEVIFPNNIINKKNPPNLIINLTNDGWFGKSSGPYQHLVATKFRAVENKIPIIRVSNSGITAFIDEYGRIIQKINLDKEGILDINI